MACHSNTKNMQGLFCSVLFLVMVISSAQEYSNRWTVQIEGEKNDFEASRLARKYGFVNHGKVIDNYYSFIHFTNGQKVSSIQSAHLYKGLLSEPNVKLVKQQEMKSYKLLSPQLMDFYNPNDPRFGDMWYIKRDNGPTYNVIDVWRRNITGEGVVVAVVDEGLDPEHPEIKANYDANASFDVIDNDTIPAPANSSIPQFGHGDKVAGVIGGVLNNSECGVGVAYNVKLGGIRLFFDEMATDDLECKALSFKRDYVDIYCNSWGPDDRGFEVVGPGPLTQRALKRGAEEGRRGLGSIFVFAAGNGGLIVRDSCAFNGYVNSIYTIAITGINSDGSIPIYGEHCAGIMAVTYSRDIFGDKSKVITADANKTCTDSFGASSASAAMASGLIALMLSANRDLTWRDVQHIIVRTASPDPVRIGSLWSQNKAKLFVNDYVGFGLMDASRMVDAALNWTTVPPKVNCTISGPLTNSAILSKGKLEEIIDVSSDNWRIFCGERINHLEHVEVRVNLTYSRRGDLLIKLISPQGTVSNLTHYRSADSFFKTTDLDFVLMTLHFWGENAVGLWKLTLENSQPQHTNEGTLFNWTLSLHGTKDDPLASNRHVPTPAFPRTTDKPTTADSSKVTGIIVGSVCAGVVVIACAGGAAYFGYKKFYSS